MSKVTNSLLSLALLACAALAIMASSVSAQLVLPDISSMLSRHMLSHILLMNIAAPFISALFYRRTLTHKWLLRPSTLVVASVAQLLLLFGWHIPSVMNAVMATPALSTAMHVSLFFSAFWFWLAIYRQTNNHIGRVLAALLVTGKLYCLMAALLVFAPRSLYADAAAVTSISLADQQLSGVMMVVACPLSYVLIATVLAARWLAGLHYVSQFSDTVKGGSDTRCA